MAKHEFILEDLSELTGDNSPRVDSSIDSPENQGIVVLFLPKDDEIIPVAILFDTDDWTLDDAREYLADRGTKYYGYRLLA